MLDDEFKKDRAKVVRDLADKADPFTKRRLDHFPLRGDEDFTSVPGRRLNPRGFEGRLAPLRWPYAHPLADCWT
jgi:hypothetical protein